MTNAEKYAWGIREQLTELVKNWEEEEQTLEEYLEDNCGYWFIIDGNGDYESVKVMVTVGGPNCCIDTWSRSIICNWGLEKAVVDLENDIATEIDYYFKNIYEAEKEEW